MPTFADIEKEWFSEKADKEAEQFMASFENALKHFSICSLPIPDADLAMATRVFDNAARYLKAKGRTL